MIFFVHWPIFWAIIPLHKRALKFPFPPFLYSGDFDERRGGGREKREKFAMENGGFDGWGERKER